MPLLKQPGHPNINMENPFISEENTDNTNEPLHTEETIDLHEVAQLANRTALRTLAYYGGEDRFEIVIRRGGGKTIPLPFDYDKYSVTPYPDLAEAPEIDECQTRDPETYTPEKQKDTPRKYWHRFSKHEACEALKNGDLVASATGPEASLPIEISILFDTWGNGDPSTYEEVHTMMFQDGLLIGSTHKDGKSYRYDKDKKQITFSMPAGSYGLQGYEGLITPDSAVMHELTEIGYHNQLETIYTSNSDRSQAPSLILEAIRMTPAGNAGRLNDYYPLPNEDIDKILPHGRALSIQDIWADLITPTRPITKHRGNIRPLDRSRGFIPLGYGESFNLFQTPGSENVDGTINGSVHPLKDSDSSWLIFANFRRDSSVDNSTHYQNRALVTSLDVGSVQALEDDGELRISFNIEIDDEEFSLNIPAGDKVKWVRPSDETQVASQGGGVSTPKGHYISISKEELQEWLDEGDRYCIEQMLEAALEFYYEKHYLN